MRNQAPGGAGLIARGAELRTNLDLLTAIVGIGVVTAAKLLAEFADHAPAVPVLGDPGDHLQDPESLTDRPRGVDGRPALCRAGSVQSKLG